MNTLHFIILSLAVWRITKIIVDEKGPYDAVENFRNKILNYKWSPVHCFKCTSVWSAALLSLLLGLPLHLYIIYWLSSSAVAIFIWKLIDKSE